MMSLAIASPRFWSPTLFEERAQKKALLFIPSAQARRKYSMYMHVRVGVFSPRISPANGLNSTEYRHLMI